MSNRTEETTDELDGRISVGRTMEATARKRYRIEVGRIAEAWLGVDVLGLHQRVGAVHGRGL